MNMSRYDRILLLLSVIAIAVTLALTSCEDNPTDEDAVTKLRIVIHSGNNQTERIGAQLPKPMVVQVTDILDNPQTGIRVTFGTANPGAAMNPDTARTNSLGFASCSYRLGTMPGTHNMTAAIDDGNTVFTAYAEEIECPEEELSRLDDWPADHIFVTTTSSSLLDGTGSVVIDVDPETKSITKVLETTETLIDLAFSPRGELFVTTEEKIFKVNPSPRGLEEYGSYPQQWNVELIANPGGILVGVSPTDIFKVTCRPSTIQSIYTLEYFSLSNGNFALHPAERNLYLIKGNPPLYRIYQAPWNGRSTSIESLDDLGIFINVNAADPKGMCIDSTGTLYITFDTSSGYGNYRRIVAVYTTGLIDDGFFDFYARAGGNSAAAGRWGDITIMAGNLYLIDTRNDRLVVISTEGIWQDEIASTAFSQTWVETERYGIASMTH